MTPQPGLMVQLSLEDIQPVATFTENMDRGMIRRIRLYDPVGENGMRRRSLHVEEVVHRDGRFVEEQTVSVAGSYLISFTAVDGSSHSPSTLAQVASIGALADAEIAQLRDLPVYSIAMPATHRVLTQEAIDELRKLPGVECVERNYVRFSASYPDDPYLSSQWFHENDGRSASGLVDADVDSVEAWNEEPTANRCDPGTVVAVLDSGIDRMHVDLKNNIWSNAKETKPDARDGHDDDLNGYQDDYHGWDFVDDDNDPGPVPSIGGCPRCYAHGTQVAGVVAAVGNNSTGVIGMCPTGRVMNLRVTGPDGTVTDANLIAALDYAVKMRATVANLSLGTDGGYSECVKQAIERANVGNTLVVASAGNQKNNNDLKPSYPASYALDNLISVAATSRTDEIWHASNCGANSVHVAAPGLAINTTIPGNDYATANGTSMSAAIVSGVAALIRSKYPHLTPLEVKDRIVQSAERCSTLEGLVKSAARVSAYAALTIPLATRNKEVCPLNRP